MIPVENNSTAMNEVMKMINLLTIPLPVMVTFFPFSGGSGSYVSVRFVTSKPLLAMDGWINMYVMTSTLTNLPQEKSEVHDISSGSFTSGMALTRTRQNVARTKTTDFIITVNCLAGN